jgi:hypothetical protein
MPLLLVHLANTPNSRLLSLIWVFTIIPGLFLFFSLNHKAKLLASTSRLNKTADPHTLRKWTIAFRFISFLAAIAWFLYFTVPIWAGTYKVCILHQPFIEIQDTITSVRSTVLTPGLYWSIHTKNDQSTAYAYLFPTIYRFGSDKYVIMILPGTRFVLDIEPINNGT